MQIDLSNINETPHLLDILLEIEDVLDSLDLYVYKNWLNGEVCHGPVIHRYWVSVTLKFAKNRMPDPRAGFRLLKHGIMLKFRKAQEEGVHGADNTEVWLVDIEVPRKLLNGMNDASTDFYNDEIDVDDIEGAIDSGIDTETGYVTDTGVVK